MSVDTGNWCKFGQKICCLNHFQFTIKNEERDRDQNVVHSLRDRKSPKKTLNGKLTRPSEEREWLSKKLCEAEADVEARNWEKRNSDIAFHEINQDFEISTISPTSSESTGRPGSERSNQLAWRLGIEK